MNKPACFIRGLIICGVLQISATSAWAHGGVQWSVTVAPPAPVYGYTAPPPGVFYPQSPYIYGPPPSVYTPPPVIYSQPNVIYGAPPPVYPSWREREWHEHHHDRRDDGRPRWGYNDPRR